MPGLLEKLTGRIGDDFYKLMPSDWRRRDHLSLPCKRIRNLSVQELKIHRRLLALIGDIYEDQVVIPIQNVLYWHDPLRCPVENLPALALEMGWPLDTSLDETTQRLIVRSIKTLVYDEIGNVPEGLQKAIYGFTGIQVQIEVYGNEPHGFGLDDPDIGLDDGVSALTVPRDLFGFGFDSEIEGCGLDGLAALSETAGDPVSSEADRRALFTFVVTVPWEVTAAQLKIIDFLCDYMRPARMHYVIEQAIGGGDKAFGDYQYFGFDSGGVDAADRLGA